MIGRKKKIVLYFPQHADERYGLSSDKDLLPLSLLTIAAWPLADGYEIVLIDGNLYAQQDAHRRVVEACEGALIYATTGILGYQVADGYLCSQKVKARHPKIASIIGGWFASTMPELQLASGLYDAIADEATCAPPASGTVEGALRSGERAAIAGRSLRGRR